MARRKTNLFDDIIDIFSSLPWWVGIPFAALSYYGFEFLSTSHIVHSNNAAVNGMLGGLFSILLHYARYVITGLILIAVLISRIKTYKRQSLFKTANNLRAIRTMTWQKFELVVGQYFRESGYSVQETGGGGADGGIDLVVSKGSERFLVQCKQWKATKVRVDVVREHYGLVASHGATGGFIITCGDFTKDALAFAKGLNLQLIDGRTLEKLIGETGRVTMTPSGPIESKLYRAILKTPDPQCVRNVALKCLNEKQSRVFMPAITIVQTTFNNARLGLPQ